MGTAGTAGGNEVGERIVAAAHRLTNGKVLICVRHFDAFVQVAVDLFGEDVLKRSEQGFYTNRYRYVTRQEAFQIAVQAQQMVRRVGGDDSNGGTLYSENLY